MESIRPLTGLSIETLYRAFNEAFKDYDRTWTSPEFETMLRRRGYSPDHSFGAFVRERLVAFTLNCVDDWKGLKTAYDTGTGTLSAFRGRGLASRLFNESIPYLQRAGVKQYLLEVLQHNTDAVSVYKRLGFEVSRGLDYFAGSAADVALTDKALPQKYSVLATDLSFKNQMAEMWDFIPSWQNSFSSILREPEGFIIKGAFDRGTLVGYGILEPSSGDITQLAVAKEHRRLGIGSVILKELLVLNRHPAVKIINTDEGNEAVRAFAANNGIPLLGSQFEMVKSLQ